MSRDRINPASFIYIYKHDMPLYQTPETEDIFVNSVWYAAKVTDYIDTVCWKILPTYSFISKVFWVPYQGAGPITFHWRHNELDSVSDHQTRDCLLTCLFRHRSKKTSNLCIAGLCEGNSPGTGEFPAQKASNAENVSIWWRHHESKTFDAH